MLRASLRTLLQLSALFSAFATVATAIPIQGEISFSGSFTLLAPSPAPLSLNLGNAAGFASFSNVFVADGATEDYAGLDGTDVTMYGFNFTDFPATGVRWWELSADPTTAFDIVSLDIDYRAPKAIVLSGLGMAHMNGRESYLSEWSLTANMGKYTFSFSGTETILPAPPAVPVPEGGTTFALMGAALITGSGLLRFRRR